MVAPLLQVVVGFTGIMGFLLKFIGPITIAPCVALIGISFIGSAASRAGLHWGISVFAESQNYGYRARTDLNPEVVNNAQWFRIPYPGQWGVPVVTLAGVFVMFSAVVASVLDSLGDYYEIARLVGAPPPPPHAVNRGIAFDGIGCVLAGVWGAANGNTSFSTNAGLVGITKVGSIFVIQICAVIMIIVGMLGKFTAFISTIPLPIVGGVICVLLGLIVAAGLSNLQYVDLNSSRNLLIIGFSLFMGMLLPLWVDTDENDKLIETGITHLDRVIKVVLTTEAFIGGVFAFILDNLLPGTREERGIIAFTKYYNKQTTDTEGFSSIHIYDFPLGMSFIRKWKWTRYIPVCPTFLYTGLVDGDNDSVL
ncbi:solute carrier family 23 member 1-like [Amphiura filiformis]|uniref:solute carrier family 23 member 1-like n=1 Tax=Amphiura filiformis TaxID=82378 RepID=UPI003B2199ED